MIVNSADFLLLESQESLIAPLLILAVLSIYYYRWNCEYSNCRMESDQVDEKSQRDDFIYDMRVMRATRFNFSKRLEKRSKVKAFTVNILSVISIFVSVYLLANASGISEVELKKISVTIIGLSLLALWMSLDTPSPELLRKANDAHQCGREISEIYRAFKYEMINISDAAKKYEAVISKYSENHDQLDRAKTLYDDREKHPRKANGLTKYNTTWLHWVSSYSPALLAFSCCVAIFIFQLVFPM